MLPRPTVFDETFPHDWQAEILPAPPMIAPARHVFYPRAVEEIERGALQVLVRSQPGAAPLLATFALGFAAPALPHGLWSCPHPGQLCAIAGGYAYLIDAADPGQWSQVPYRPVVSVHPVLEAGLLLFSSFHQIWALGREGFRWQTGKLSWEGLRIGAITAERMEGFGWDMFTDTEIAFTVDLVTGRHQGGACPQ